MPAVGSNRSLIQLASHPWPRFIARLKVTKLSTQRPFLTRLIYSMRILLTIVTVVNNLTLVKFSETGAIEYSYDV